VRLDDPRPQVIFLRDTVATRSSDHDEFAAPSDAAQLDGVAVEDTCALHHDCDQGGRVHDGHAHGHVHFAWLLDTQALGPKAIVPLLLTIVLSVHSFIAGMALGVQESSAAAVPTLIAIVAHKWVEAISLGVSIVRVTPDRRVLLRYAPVYALDCVSPRFHG
jgi:zinc transporter ZupT